MLPLWFCSLSYGIGSNFKNLTGAAFLKIKIQCIKNSSSLFMHDIYFLM